LPSNSTAIVSTSFQAPQSGSFVPNIQTEANAITLYFPGHEKPLSIPSKDMLLLGRGAVGQPQPDIDLNPYQGALAGVSRSHAVIRINETSITIEDIGSSNGTWLNESRLVPFQRYPIHNGDMLRLS